ncbi:FAD-dependent oxidoreductase [Streptomyces sp. NPDC005805]|uniref:FAD-dependent oxidoreductase n=1 Tax=Streptomyces sp. NPDC005805 TaxID=3157068 RepID=UPI00340D7B46
MQKITVVGGGFAGLTAAISAAESGARVTLHEAHHTLGGRARTADGTYRTNDGPHALYRSGPHWSWLSRHGLLPRGSVASVPARELLRFRFRRGGALRVAPPRGLLGLVRRPAAEAPVDSDYLSWATGVAGETAARAAAHFIGVALFHHDPGSLSARFVQERLRRVTALPPQARYPVGGWGTLVDRMADRARELGVRIETTARVDALPADHGPVVVATSLDAARSLLGDDTLSWPGGRTTLVDLALRTRKGDPFIVSDLDAPGWVERFSAQDRTLAPAGQSLLQCHLPVAPEESKAEGGAHADALLDLGFPGWRDRTEWRRDALSQGRTGAVDLPDTTWRDRPAIDRGDGVYLVGDQVAAPGLLSEVSFTSALEAVSLALRAGGRRAAGPSAPSGAVGTP